MEIKVRLRLGHMELYGSNTLVGKMVSQNPEVPMASVKKLTIEIEVTSDKWKEDNNGPHLSIVPEYVSAELIRDVLYLVKSGIEIDVVNVISDDC